MRIVGGKFRSRIIESVEGTATRPTMEKVREALFGRIGYELVDKTMLDLFAGSGAVSLEGISRGMREAVLVDGAQDAIDTIKHNIKKLGVNEQCMVLRMEAFQAMRYLKGKEKKFDFIFIDPPYGKVDIKKVLSTLITMDLVNENGIAVIETPNKREEIEYPDEWDFEKRHDYGITSLIYLRRKKI